MLIKARSDRGKAPRQSVISPIRVPNEAGGLDAVELGSYPEGSERDSDDALTASLAVYDSGRGIWPTMSVAERIGCMQVLITGMMGAPV